MKPVTVTFAALALGAAVGCARTSAADRKKGPPPAPVVVAQAALADVPERVDAVATVEPLATVAVKAQAGGRIEAVHFTEGQDVHKGELLFQIDARPYRAALDQAQGGLARDVATARNATAQAGRAQALSAEGIISKEDHDQALATAEAQKATAQVSAGAVENARLNLGYTQVRAPIGGRTGSVLVHVGNVVTANADTPLVVINRIDPISVTFTLPEQKLGAVRAADRGGNLQVEATITGDPEPVRGGKLTFIDNQVDRETGTIKLKATFANPQGRLWPGQFVNARLTMGVERGAVVVPAAAVQAGQNGSYVFVMKADKTVEQRPVKSRAASDPATAVVDKGVRPGETVVVDGQLGLTNGTAVAVRPAAGTEAAKTGSAREADATQEGGGTRRGDQ